MAEIVWTNPALKNLSDSVEYIALSNPNAASALAKTVFSSVDRLEYFPDSGRKPNELNEFNYREIVVNPLRIFYKHKNNTAYILHVFRQEQDIRQYILDSLE